MTLRIPARLIPSPRVIALAVPAIVALAWAIAASSDALAMKLNWDSANYVAKYASGAAGWSDRPWNSHFAIGPVYWVGYWLVAPFGGSFIDGVRAVGALALAFAAVFVADTAGRLSGRIWLGTLAALVYVSSWGVSLLLFHLEDNIVYLPWVTATLWICVRRLDAWRGRDGLFCGALVAGGALISWQAGLYLFVPLYVAVVLGGRRGWATRLRDGGLIGAGFFMGLLVWVLFYGATARDQSIAELLKVMFSRPEPSFFPESWHDVRLLLSGPRRVFRHLGTGVAQELGPMVAESRVVRSVFPELGLWFFVACAAATAAATWVARRSRRWSLQMLLVVLTALTLVTSFYVDLPTDKYKRYEYLPLFFVLLLSTLAGHRRGQRGAGRAWTAGMAAIVCGVLAVEQGALAVSYAREYRMNLPQRSPPDYFGVGHEPWFVYLRRLRAATPDRCRYVFTFAEFVHGRYQLEIPAGLWAEFPDHLVLGDPGLMAEWRHPVKMAPIADWRPRSCDWLSPAATRGVGLDLPSSGKAW